MINSIQLLRAVAAIMVVMYHITIKAGQYHNDSFAWFHIGEFGVDLFFIISGFIMCYTTAQRQITFGRFMVDRVKRIIPLYWIMTTVALVVFLIAPGMVNSSGGETSIFASYTLIPNGDKLLVQNGWTLSYEFLFYLLFAGCLMAAASGRNLLYTTVAIAIFALAGLVFDPQNPTLAFITDMVLIEFALGMLAFRLLYQRQHSLLFSSLMLGIGLAMLLWQNYTGVHYTWMGRLLNGGIPMFFVFVGFVSLERYIAAAQFPLKSALMVAGDASYSIYLIHPFTLSASAKLANKFQLSSNSLVFSTILLSTSIIAGVMAYWFIEKPVNSWFKRRKSKKLAQENIATS